MVAILCSFSASNSEKTKLKEVYQIKDTSSIYLIDSSILYVGNSPMGPVLNLYTKNSLCYSMNAGDAYNFSLDTLIDLNSDAIKDLVVSERYCDGHSIIIFLSNSNSCYKQITTNADYSDSYCLDNSDLLKNLIPLQTKDVNGDEILDILINHVDSAGKVVGTLCGDTIIIK